MIRRIVPFLFFALVLSAQEGRNSFSFDIGGKTVRIVCDHFETYREDEGIFRPYGNVEVYWDQYRLQADFLEIDRKNKRLLAEGRVVFSDATSVLSGIQLKFDMETQSGELADAYGLFSPFLNFETEMIRQGDEETYSFQKMKMTSCNQAVPYWKISCRKGKLKKEKYVEMNDAVLKILTVPVLYLPYLRYPISKDGKQTGFLIPSFGNSTYVGRHISESFFWNIRSNIDLTLFFEHYGRVGLGLGQELRYLFRHANGNIRLFSLLPGVGAKLDDESPITQADIDRLKGEGWKNFMLDMSHQQEVPFLNTRISIESRLPGNPEILKYLDRRFESTQLMSFDSSVSWITSISEHLRLSFESSRNQSYNIFTGESETRDVLPNLSLALDRQELGGIPGEFSLLASFSRQVRNGESQYVQPDFVFGKPSQRIRLDPSYRVELVKATWMQANVEVASKNSFYQSSLDPETGEVVDEPLSLHYQTARINLQGPSFSKVFGGSGRRFKHVISPGFEFSYATTVKNIELLAPVDYSDFPDSPTATFSISSRLLTRSGKPDSQPRQLLNLQIGQSYYLDPETANYGMKINDEYPVFSELVGSVNLQPINDLSISASMSWNHYLPGFSRMNLNLEYDRSGAPVRGRLGYSKYRNPFGGKEHQSYHTVLRGGLDINIPGFPIKFSSQVDYNFIFEQLTLGLVQLNLDLQCLTISGQLTVFSRGGTYYFAPLFTVSLGNLGMGSPFFKE